MENMPDKNIDPENIETDLTQAQDKQNAAESDRRAPDDKNFPGYPHYPAQEDLLNPANNSGRVEVDIDQVDPSDSNGE